MDTSNVFKTSAEIFNDFLCIKYLKKNLPLRLLKLNQSNFLNGFLKFSKNSK